MELSKLAPRSRADLLDALHLLVDEVLEARLLRTSILAVGLLDGQHGTLVDSTSAA